MKKLLKKFQNFLKLKIKKKLLKIIQKKLKKKKRKLKKKRLRKLQKNLNLELVFFLVFLKNLKMIQIKKNKKIHLLKIYFKQKETEE